MFAAFTAMVWVGPVRADVVYSNDFSGAGANVALTNQAPSGNWSVGGGTYNMTVTDTTTLARTASVNLGASLDAQSFTMEMDFNASSVFSGNNYNAATIGFGLFGTDTVFTGGSSNPYFLADFTFQGSSAGQLRILSIGTGSGGANVPVGTNGSAIATGHLSGFAINTHTNYSLRLNAVYDPDLLSLTMTLGLYDGSGTLLGTQAGGSTTGLLTGDYFGIRNRIGQGGGTTTIAFDNLNISTAAIPEPASCAYWLGGAAAVAFCLRRVLRRQPSR